MEHYIKHKEQMHTSPSLLQDLNVLKSLGYSYKHVCMYVCAHTHPLQRIYIDIHPLLFNP